MADHTTLVPVDGTLDATEEGLQVYNTTTDKVMLWDGAAWVVTSNDSKWDNVAYTDTEANTHDLTYLKNALVQYDTIGYDASTRTFKFVDANVSTKKRLAIQLADTESNTLNVSSREEDVNNIYNALISSTKKDIATNHFAIFVSSQKSSTVNSTGSMKAVRVRQTAYANAGIVDSGENIGVEVSGFLGGGGTISKSYSYSAQPQIFQNSTVTNYMGVRSSFTLNDGGNVTTAVLFNAVSLFKSVTAGTITNLYGFYAENITGGTSLNYAIYTNAGKVRFGDNVETTGTLKVVGLPVFADNAAAASLSAGDFYRTATGQVMVKY